jgi:guanosine-diphosphatase
MGPSRTGGLRRFGWKKFAIGAAVVITLVWVFGPRKEDIIPEKYIPSVSMSVSLDLLLSAVPCRLP